MTEADLWNLLDGSMGALWAAQRHEDSVSPDIPDVSYTYRGTGGWIELKASNRVGGAPVAMPKLRPGQLNWLHRRAAHGSPAFIAWATGGRVLLIPAVRIAEFDEKHTMENWQLMALASPRLYQPEIQVALKHSLQWRP